MRVTQRARLAFAAAALLVGALPAAYALRASTAAAPNAVEAGLSAARGDDEPQRVQEASARPGAFPAPVFTLLPPGAPLTEAPSASEALEKTAEPPLSARLSINTRPWSTVYLGKRMLGSTPLADVPIPRGPLTLRLVDRDGRVHVRRLPASRERTRIAFFEF